MATRSNIAIVNEDKSISSIYCHWDGYPEYVGKVLRNHYTTADSVNELLKLGNLSNIGQNLFSEGHTWAVPIEGVCLAYGRDRREKDQEAIVFEDLGEFEDSADNSWVDYQYLFENNKWSYRNVNKKIGWKELTSEVCKG
jgi:hypothetical protein